GPGGGVQREGVAAVVEPPGQVDLAPRALQRAEPGGGEAPAEVQRAALDGDHARVRPRLRVDGHDGAVLGDDRAEVLEDPDGVLDLEPRTGRGGREQTAVRQPVEAADADAGR